MAREPLSPPLNRADVIFVDGFFRPAVTALLDERDALRAALWQVDHALAEQGEAEDSLLRSIARGALRAP